jgi:hypothetical protein
MAEKAKKELLKEMEDIKGLLSHLEDEYRKANVSEKYYQELKEKYLKRLEEIEKKIGAKKESEDESKKGEKKGIFGKLFGKKEEKKEEEKVEKKQEVEIGEIEEVTPEVIEKLAQQVAEQAGVTPTAEIEEVPEEKAELPTSVEIEKLKVMIDSC